MTWIVIPPDSWVAGLRDLVFDGNGKLHSGLLLNPGGCGTPLFVRFDDPADHDAAVELIEETGLLVSYQDEIRWTGHMRKGDHYFERTGHQVT